MSAYGIPMGVKHRVDAYGPAQHMADEACLAMTVFYHPDHGWNFANALARVLHDRQTKVFVTWLPSRYFEGWQS